MEDRKSKLKQFWENLRIGDGHAAGMARKGAVELGQYLPAFNQAGTTTIEDPGVFPNATQMETNNQKGVDGIDAEQQRSRGR